MKEDHLHAHHSFSNPIAPPGHVTDDDKDDSKPLSNEDFRKLVMSTRGTPSGGTKEKVLGMGNSVRGVRVSSSVPATPNVSSSAHHHHNHHLEEREAAERRRKKKTEYLKQRKLELEKEAELASKYRDRARERRDHQEKDDENAAAVAAAEKATQNYHAVNPNAKEGESDQRRNQIIQESKFLGGDMEHTHLVKGLDYALLQKVKAEIHHKETEINEDEKLDLLVNKAKDAARKESREESSCGVEVKSVMAKNIHRLLFCTELPEKNQLFAPGRMAYVVELEDEFVESDVPTTVVRSKVDCPALLVPDASVSSSANDLVVNKLTQILSYLRQGNRGGRKWKKKLAAPTKEVFDPATEEGIFGHDLGDADGKENKAVVGAGTGGGVESGSGGKGESSKRVSQDGGGSADRDQSRNRRDRSQSPDAGRKRQTRVRFADCERDDKPPEQPPISAAELIKNINAKYSHYGSAPEKPKSTSEKLAQKQADCYSECYPGMDCDDVVDSDDDADFSKMDQGNKKGPVGRWDFETTEEYSDYMSHKEALPKAAFQFGVKMADGRKTRRVKPQTERQKLEREWKQISKILEKRQDHSQGGGKKPKY